jgi:hypothetical protein
VRLQRAAAARDTAAPAAAAAAAPSAAAAAGASLSVPAGACYCRYDTDYATWALGEEPCKVALLARCAAGALPCAWLDAFYGHGAGAALGHSLPHEADIRAFVFDDCQPQPPCACAGVRFDGSDASECQRVGAPPGGGPAPPRPGGARTDPTAAAAAPHRAVRRARCEPSRPHARSLTPRRPAPPPAPAAAASYACCRDLRAACRTPFSGLACPQVEAFCADDAPSARLLAWTQHKLRRQEAACAAYAGTPYAFVSLSQPSTPRTAAAGAAVPLSAGASSALHALAADGRAALAAVALGATLLAAAFAGMAWTLLAPAAARGSGAAERAQHRAPLLHAAPEAAAHDDDNP